MSDARVIRHKKLLWVLNSTEKSIKASPQIIILYASRSHKDVSRLKRHILVGRNEERCD